MAKREKNPDSGTVFGAYSFEVRNIIQRLASRARQAVIQCVTYGDLWDMMYPKQDHETLLKYIPRMGNTANFVRAKDTAGRLVRITASDYQRDGVPRPVFLKQEYWEGDRKDEVLEKITDISGQLQMVSAQWEDVYNTFEFLNREVRTLNKMFSLWPAIKQLCERANMGHACIAAMGEYRHYPVPNMTNSQFNAMRGSLPVVGMAMIMTDEIEYDPSVVITYDGLEI